MCGVLVCCVLILDGLCCCMHRCSLFVVCCLLRAVNCICRVLFVVVRCVWCVVCSLLAWYVLSVRFCFLCDDDCL